ncbi:MAG TPA: alpha/beta fold hydrolase [Candidatus Dormibacteraeota bacterium]|nr:alpha/beta fold hydrolase [Candidatus Dormibacteraeota bacterium]
MAALAFHDTGEGPVLLMLHAFPLEASMWDAQVAALSGRYRCLRPDFWGCGASPPPAGQVTIDGYAATLLEELDRIGVSEFAVCGLSMGGYAAFALLRAARDRVTALVLSNTRAAADDDPARAARMKMADDVRAGGVEAIVEPMTERLLCRRCREEAHIADPVRGRIRMCTDVGVIAAIEAIAGRPDSIPLLGEITVPTLVVCGTDDVIVPLPESRAMAAAIRGAELHAFEGGAHLVNLEQPQAYTSALGHFLDGALPV